MSLSYSERSWWGEGKGSMRRRKRGRLHRKRRFYDPKDGENITCVAKAHTLRAAPRSTLVLYIFIYIYIQRFLRLAATDAPFKCVYLFLESVSACKQYSFHRLYNQNKNIKAIFFPAGLATPPITGHKCPHIVCETMATHKSRAAVKVDKKKQTQIRIRSNTTCIYNIIYRPYNIEQYRNIEKINRKKNDQKRIVLSTTTVYIAERSEDLTACRRRWTDVVYVHNVIYFLLPQRLTRGFHRWPSFFGPIV